ncbi:MAG: acyloxyacyl hydrolase [Gammaproteobacteria bacterium]
MRLIATTLSVPLLLLAQTPAMASSPPSWIDSISLTLGKDNRSNDTEAYRIGFQNKWERSWFEGGAWFLSGYWDAELGYLETDIGKYNELFDLSVTPVLRLQRDADLSSGMTPYADAGFGPHLISETRLGKRDLSSTFQFGLLVGVGVGFGERGQYELSYRFQHISNADIKQPNDGLDLHLLRLGYHFE